MAVKPKAIPSTQLASVESKAIGSVDIAFARFVRSGRPSDLARVFDATAPELLRLASHLVSDLSLAEDLVQSTFLVAIENCDDYAPDRPVLHWLTGILTNRARELRRNMARQPDPERLPVVSVTEPPQAAAATEFTKVVSDAIARMPQPYRPVLMMHLKLGQPIQEIALVLERAPGTVRKQLGRGTAMLRRALPRGLATGIGTLSLEKPALDSIREVVLARAASAAVRTAIPTVPAASSALVGGILIMKAKLSFAAISVVVVILAVWLLAPEWFAGHPFDPNREQVAPLARGGGEPKPDGSSVVDDRLQRQHAEQRTELPDADAVAPERQHVGPTGSLRIRAWLPAQPKRIPAPFMDLEVMSGSTSRTIIPDRNVKTDADGAALVRGLPEGDIFVVSGRGLIGQTRATIAAGSEVAVDLVIERAIRIGGVVTNWGGDPIANARVEFNAFRPSKPLLQVGRTGPDGTFVVDAVSRIGIVSARARGYHPVDAQVIPDSEAARTNMRIVLADDGGTVRGVVENGSGEPIAGARVRVGKEVNIHRVIRTRDGIERHGLAQIEVVTDEHGAFLVEGLPVGEVPVFVKAASMAPWTGSVFAPAKGAAEMRAVLAPGARVVGFAMLPGAEPARGSYITAGTPLGKDAWHLRFRTRVAADGSFALTGLPIGPVTITAYRDGEKQSREIIGASGQQTRVEFYFGPQVKLTGRVQSEGGRGLSGITLSVFARRPNGAVFVERFGRTDANGDFVFDRLPSGQLYTVQFVDRSLPRVVKKNVDPGFGELVITVPDR